MANKNIGNIGKKFTKGDPRINRKGRPPILPLLQEAIETACNGGAEIEEIIIALINKAKKGDVIAAREILDRYYGKPKQQMDIKADVNVSNDLPTIIIQ